MIEKGLAAKETERWTYAAARSALVNPRLAEEQAIMAKRLRLRRRVKAPYELKLLFCRKCKKYSPLGISSTIRLRKGWLVIRCSLCERVYRKRLKVGRR
jgi:ribonuclease P protein subunit RPR2